MAEVADECMWRSPEPLAATFVRDSSLDGDDNSDSCGQHPVAGCDGLKLGGHRKVDVPQDARGVD